jgi:hypothetical protein
VTNDSVITSRGRNARTLAALLAGAWRNVPPVVNQSVEDLAAVVPLLLGSGTAALGWWRVRNSDLSTSTAATSLQNAYRFQVLEGSLHCREIKEVFALLRSVGVEPILIKGWAIGRLYPKGLRPSGDIDLYVHPQQQRLAMCMIRDRESTRYGVDFQHQELTGMDEKGIDRLYKRSLLVGLDGLDVRVMGPEDHLRFLCIHLLRHGAWRPLWLCDVSVALETRRANFDWDCALGKSRRHADWIACAIGLARYLLGAQLRDTPVAHRANNLPSWLLPNVLKEWEAPYAINQAPLNYRMPMANYFRKPTGILKDLRARWPNPIEATISVDGPFNEMPRLFFQLAESILRTTGFIARLPRLLKKRESEN